MLIIVYMYMQNVHSTLEDQTPVDVVLTCALCVHERNKLGKYLDTFKAEQ